MPKDTGAQNASVTVGILYPGNSASDDYAVIEKMLGDVRLPLAHTQLYDHKHTLAAARAAGSEDMLIQGALQLADENLDSIMWASTSGSFAYGPKDAQAQAYGLYEIAAVPASSTAFAFTEAVRHLGVKSVAVADSYPLELAEKFAEFLRYCEIDVIGFLDGGSSAASIPLESTKPAVLNLVEAAHKKYPDAEAILLPGTVLRTVEFTSELEARVNKPVLTANQVTAWYGLQIAGYKKPHKNLGTLFAKNA